MNSTVPLCVCSHSMPISLREHLLNISRIRLVQIPISAQKRGAATPKCYSTTLKCSCRYAAIAHPQTESTGHLHRKSMNRRRHQRGRTGEHGARDLERPACGVGEGHDGTMTGLPSQTAGGLQLVEHGMSSSALGHSHTRPAVSPGSVTMPLPSLLSGIERSHGFPRAGAPAPSRRSASWSTRHPAIVET